MTRLLGLFFKESFSAVRVTDYVVSHFGPEVEIPPFLRMRKEKWSITQEMCLNR